MYDEFGSLKIGYNTEIDDLKHIQEHGYDWIVEYQKSLIKTTNIQSLKIKYIVIIFFKWKKES